jgi:hypothetical protein
MAKAQGIDTGSWRTRAATMEGSFRRLELARVAEELAVMRALAADSRKEDGGGGLQVKLAGRSRKK